MRKSPLVLVMLYVASVAWAQANWNLVDPLLTQHLESQPVVADELQHFMLQRVPLLVVPSDSKQWDQKEELIRAHELSVLYHGWPQAWIQSPPKFEKVGVLEGHGYRIVKLRYEVVPGLKSAALLYEPLNTSGRLPAILNVSGHGSGGKAVEHQQKRCINYARRGILALSLEWFDFGELAQPGNGHDFLGLLDLAGYNGLGLFYLEMRRGLDYLYDDPNVDRSRIGITGVSGGGWQSIVLSSLDTRVLAAAPVAGYVSMTTSIEHPDYSGDDAETNASDFRQQYDYAQLTAIRAPRPTLLIYNAMDDCCYRAGAAQQGVFFDIQPFFRLYGKPDNLEWHENQDPGTHNYDVDNREASYRFFDSVFHINASLSEDPDTDSEVRSYADLTVGLPSDNLTILGLARALAKGIHHEDRLPLAAETAESQRRMLGDVARYSPVSVTHAWLISTTHEKGIDSHAYRFEFSNGLSASGILFHSMTAAWDAPATILISDGGMASKDEVLSVAENVNRGRRVLAFDPLFFGENIPGTNERFNVPVFAQLLNGMGERPVGLEAAQVNAVIRWLAEGLDRGSPTPPDTKIKNASVPPVQAITNGMRSETVALVAAAMDPKHFSEIDARNSISSFEYAFDHAIKYDDAPELMCLDLYRDFDISTLTALASPAKVNLASTPPVPIFW